MARLTLAALLVVLGAVPLMAQSSSIIDHYSLTLGTYLSSQNATVRADGTGGTPGTPIDFNETFGVGKNASLGRFNFDWRVGQRHVVSFGGYRTSRERSKALERDIEFNGQVFHVNTVVTGKLTNTFYDAAYTYYPYLREDRAFGVTFSLVTEGVKVKLTSEPVSGGTAEYSARTSANLPAPGFGISYRHRIADAWQFDVRASALPKITIDKYHAKTTNLIGSVEYRFLNHYSLGVAYDYFSYTVGVDASGNNANFNGEFKYKIQGPQAYGRIYW